MKTYLVTGAAGFIGANYIKYILAKHSDIKVVVLDALTYAGNLGTIAKDIDNERCYFVKGNICDRSLADQLSLALVAAENGITLPLEGEIPPEFWNDVPAPPLSLALTAYLAAMESMEFTRPQLKELLPRVIADSTPLSLSDPKTQEAGSRILFYFLYRYVLRGVWSGLVAEKVRLAGTWTAPRRTGGFWTPPYFTAAKWSTPRKIWSSSMSNYAARITNIHNISVYS